MGINKKDISFEPNNNRTINLNTIISQHQLKNVSNIDYYFVQNEELRRLNRIKKIQRPPLKSISFLYHDPNNNDVSTSTIKIDVDQKKIKSQANFIQCLPPPETKVMIETQDQLDGGLWNENERLVYQSLLTVNLKREALPVPKNKRKLIVLSQRELRNYILNSNYILDM